MEADGTTPLTRKQIAKFMKDPRSVRAYEELQNKTLPDTGVIAGGYGDATKTISITVDEKGRLTAAQSFDLNTDNITEGLVNQFFTTARARASVSIVPDDSLTYDPETGQFGLADDVLVRGNLEVEGETFLGEVVHTGEGATTGQVVIEVGDRRTGIGNVSVDFHATASPGTDYEARVFRGGGVNGPLQFENTGTGNFDISQASTTAIRMRIAGNDRIRATNTGADVLGTLDVTGQSNLAENVSTGKGSTTGQVVIEVGGLRTASGDVSVDLHAVSGTDYEARLFRGAGTNGPLQLQNTGTGNLDISQASTTAIRMRINGGDRLLIQNDGVESKVSLFAADGATTMTNGFIYVPSGGGPPSGIPTALGNRSPVFVDALNSRLYVYLAGAWKYCALI